MLLISRTTIVLAIILFSALPGTSFSSAAPQDESQDYRLITLERLPTAGERSRLRAAGIELVEYRGGTTYLVRMAGDRGPLPMVASTRSLRADDKLDHAFIKSKYMRQNQLADAAMPMVVRFYPEVDKANIQKLLTRITDSEPLSLTTRPYPAAIITLDRRQIMQIANIAAVRSIKPYPGHPQPTNVDAAHLANVDLVREKSAYSFVDGSGEWVAVIDGGSAGTHPDYEDRFQDGEPMEPNSHASHVSGTIAGAGIGNPKALGMAPKVHIVNYSEHNKPFESMLDAYDRFGTHLANNSWGVHSGGWSSRFVEGELSPVYILPPQPSELDYYSEVTNETALQADMLLIFSAGNSTAGGYIGPHYHFNDLVPANDLTMYEDFHPPSGPYGTLVSVGLSKNVLTVGATEDDGFITDYSSKGPTKGGRIKPDVAANGRNLLSTDTDGGYYINNGTSMAAPTTTGTAALLRQLYREVHGGNIDAVSLKNLIIHSVRDDFGPPGPDYKYGFGLVDARHAADMVKQAALVDSPKDLLQVTDTDRATVVFTNGSIDHRDRQQQTFRVRGENEVLRVSIVWNDQPGEKLVNNINMWLVGPGSKKKHFPYRLDPKHPEQPAKQKRNRTDNVELVEIFGPAPGLWTLYLHGKKIPMGPQDFSLILTVGKINTKNIKSKAGRLGDVRISFVNDFPGDDSLNKDTFDVGESIWIKPQYQILENSIGDSIYLLTVATEVFVHDEDGKLIFFDSGRTNQYDYAGPHGEEFLSSWHEVGYVSEWMRGKRYRVTANVLLYNGATATAERWFSVN